MIDDEKISTVNVKNPNEEGTVFIMTKAEDRVKESQRKKSKITDTKEKPPIS